MREFQHDPVRFDTHLLRLGIECPSVSGPPRGIRGTD